MREEIHRAIAVGGAIVSVYLAVLIGSFWFTNARNVTHPLEGSMVAVLTLFASPVSFVFLVLSAISSFRIQAPVLGKASLAGINIIGAVVAGGLSLLLMVLWRMGPINPG